MFCLKIVIVYKQPLNRRGPIYIKCQHQRCDDACNRALIEINGDKWSHSRVGLHPILEWLHSFQWDLCRKRHRSVDPDAWCKRGLKCIEVFEDFLMYNRIHSPTVHYSTHRIFIYPTVILSERVMKYNSLPVYSTAKINPSALINCEPKKVVSARHNLSTSSVKFREKQQGNWCNWFGEMQSTLKKNTNYTEEEHQECFTVAFSN